MRSVPAIRGLPLDQRIIRYCYLMLIVAAFTFVLGSFSQEYGPTFSESDFLSFYTAGKILLEGDVSRLYDLAYQDQITGAVKKSIGSVSELGLYPFFNPPLYAVFMAPLSSLPYAAALFLWRITSLAVLFLCAHALKKNLDIAVKWHDLAVVALVSYPAFSALKIGQNPFFSLGIYTAAYILLRNKKDLGAGLVLGLGLLKPQLFWLLPLVLIMIRRWKAVAGYTIGGGLFIAANYLIFGSGVLTDYYSLITSRSYMNLMSELRIHMHSAPTFISVLTGPGDLLFPAAAATALAVSGLTLAAVKRNYDFDTIYSLAVLGTILASPHLFYYDLLVLMLPYCIIHSRGRRSGMPACLPYLLISLFVLLWLSLFYIKVINVQLTVVLMIAIYAVTWNNDPTLKKRPTG